MAYTTVDNPELYFQTKLYSGNGSTNAITLDGSENMQPNWTWIKNRPLSGGFAHNIFDSVRGTNKKIETDNSGAQSSETNTVNSFDSDGFTLGNDAGTDEVNKSGTTFVSWNWKAGTSVSGNTTGSGSAKAYAGSVSTTAGFSIIRYVGNGTNGHTIPHHLGAAPRWILVKRLDSSSGGDWTTLHMALPNGAGDFMEFNSTGAKQTSIARWRNATPTSSVFTVASGVEVNGDDSPYIAYCFAEKQGYSKFGSYTGTEAADGAFVHLGFRPAFVIQKNSAYTGNWQMYDNKRPGFNATDNHFSANSSDPEITDNADSTMDFCASGFKLNGVDNASSNWSNLYIYMAFAEQPLVSSSGVPATAR